MANSYGVARSNHFRVKDLDEFKRAISGLYLELSHDDNGCLCITPEGDEGTWPGTLYDEANDEFLDVDLTALIAEHLTRRRSRCADGLRMGGSSPTRTVRGEP
jgi:hypothetical protein